MVQSHKRVDIISLQDELSKKNVLDTIGGIVYLVSLQEDIPSVGMVKQHALIKEDKVLFPCLLISSCIKHY